MKKQITKKRLIVFIAMFALVFTMSIGCGQDAPDAPDALAPADTNGAAEEDVAEAPADEVAEAPADGEQVVVHVRSGWTEVSLPNWADAIAIYEERNPGIRIDMEFTPLGEDSMAKLRAEFLAGNPPDVVQVWKTFFNEFVDAGLVVNLSAMYEQHGWVDGFLMPGARNWVAPLADAANPNAEAYGVADFTNTSVIFYNTDIFEELGLEQPTTMDELIYVANVISDADIMPMVIPGATGNILDFFAKVQVQFTDIQFLLDLNEGDAQFTDPPMVEAMQLVYYMFNEGVVDRRSITMTEEDAMAALATGAAAMYGMHTANDVNIAALQAEFDFNYSIMRGIEFTANPTTMTAATFGGCWIVPTFSEVQAEAKDFLFYIFGEEVSRSSAADAGRITNIVPANAYIVSETIHVVVDYQLPGLTNDSFYLIDMVPGSVLDALMAGLQGMLEGTMGYMEVLEEAQRAMNQVIADR